MTKQRSHNSRINPGTPFRGGDPLTIFDGLCRQTLVEEGREVFAGGDPLGAEMWVSHLLGMFSGFPLVGKADAGEAILGANAFRDMFAGIRDFSGGRSSLRPPGPVADGRPASPAETQKGQGHHGRRAASARVLPAAGTPGCRPACDLRPGGRE